MNRFLLTILLFTCSNSFIQILRAQDIAILEVDLQEKKLISGLPVSIDLNKVTHLSDSLLDLVEVVDGQIKGVKFQIDKEEGRKLVWMLGPVKRSSKRTFKLIHRSSEFPLPHILAKIKDGGIILGTANRPLLRYNYATFFPPRGVDEVFKRSGFIHPFWSPAGKSLTRIQAPDHYHHYGLWNPWTRLEYKGKVVDLWNLAEKQGTVRFAHIISRENGSVYGGYKVLQEHVVYEENGEEVALNEVQEVRIYQEDNRQEVYIADMSILLNCATDNSITLLEYRYGGLGWRATEKWHRDNSEIITSEGKTRKEADGSLAKWCIVQGELDEGYASVLMMSYPTNYNHPEPLRVWPEDIYDRGDVFVNFSPTKNMDWKLKPGKVYPLSYRFYVSDKKIGPEEAEILWQNYAYPPEVKVTIK